MKLRKEYFLLSNCIKLILSGWRGFAASTNYSNFIILTVLVTIQLAGCVSDDVDKQDILAAYQQALADRGPQQRIDTEGKDSKQPLDLLKPVPDGISDKFEIVVDPNTGRKIVNLKIEQAIIKALASLALVSRGILKSTAERLMV